MMWTIASEGLDRVEHRRRHLRGAGVGEQHTLVERQHRDVAAGAEHVDVRPHLQHAISEVVARRARRLSPAGLPRPWP